MYKLCLGTIFKLLSLIIKRGEQNKLYKALFLVEGDPSYLPNNNISEEKSGKRQINSNYVSHIKDIGIGQLICEYRKTLSRFVLLKAKRIPIILALKKIVESDTSLDGVEIGKPKYKKELFLETTTFDFYDLLGSFVYYCCFINSNEYEKFISKIKPQILEFSDEEKAAIRLKSDTITEIPASLSLTAVTEDFSSTFKEIKMSDYSINIPALNSVKLFRLYTADNSFRLDSLKDFLKNQIDHYLLSRTRWKKLIDERKVGQIASEAKEALNGISNEEAFSQLMLYSFMECALKAPKIFNATDKIDCFGKITKNAGTYFIPKGTIDGDSHNHLVYGSGKVEDDLSTGIKKAIVESSIIISDLAHGKNAIEHFLLDQATANTLFFDSEIQHLKKVIIPSDDNEDELAVDSLGIFVCYSTDSLKKVASVPLSEANKLIDSYVDKEIIDCLPHLESLLHQNNLTNKDVFIFFMPLEKAIADSNGVITDLKGSI